MAGLSATTVLDASARPRSAITASITSSLVARLRPKQPLADTEALAAALRSLDERLERIEAVLGDRT